MKCACVCGCKRDRMPGSWTCSDCRAGLCPAGSGKRDPRDAEPLCVYDMARAVVEVLFGDQYLPVCQGHAEQYRALDLSDPEVNVREKAERPL